MVSPGLREEDGVAASTISFAMLIFSFAVPATSDRVD
jgi:hypothetical protein